jgi:hypothetical protein
MSFLSPITLMMTAVATLVITALHFLSVRRPPVLLLPTARFVAARDVRAVSRNARPSDLLLLLLRLFALWCAGVAIAGPRWVAKAQGIGHVIVADMASRPDSATVAQAAGVALGGDDPVRFAWTDSLRGMRAELGAAWPLAWRTAASLVVRDASLDSVAVHVVAPRGGVGSTEGWAPWRRLWPGRVHTVVPPAPELPASAVPAQAGTLTVSGGPGDDVVRAAFDAHMPGLRGAAPGSEAPHVHVVRTASALSAANRAAVQVNWPIDGVPAGWNAVRDSAGALVVRGTAIVAPWARTSRAPSSQSAGARIVAQWNDGTPAALERVTGTGCTRDVGVAVPNGSDVLLAPSGRTLVAALTAPCGALTTAVPARILRDSGAVAALASASALRALLPTQQSVTPPWLPALLLGLAIGALLLELALRRGSAGEERA